MGIFLNYPAEMPDFFHRFKSFFPEAPSNIAGGQAGKRRGAPWERRNW
jgi:hypothetical protein